MCQDEDPGEYQLNYIVTEHNSSTGALILTEIVTMNMLLHSSLTLDNGDAREDESSETCWYDNQCIRAEINIETI